MAFARFERPIQDEAGNIIMSAYVEVRREVPGSPLAVPIYADIDGDATKDNPFHVSDGIAAFHAVGGLYRIRVYAPGYERVYRYVPLGTAQAADVDAYAQAGFTWAPESATGTPPTTGAIRFDDEDVTAAEHIFLSADTLGGSDASAWLNRFEAGSTILLSTGVGIEWSWEIVSITDESDYYDIEVDPGSYAGPVGPLSLGDSGFVTVSREGAGSKGEQGEKGDDGDPGQNVVWLAGAGAPGSGAGDDGDMYLNTSTGDVYGPKAAGAWGSTITNLIGPAGGPGPANSLAIGTVSGGDEADASITGTAPSQTLNLTLPKGDPGTPGAVGNDGWTPVLALVADGARYVQQVADWTGGEGTKPATGKYVGATGLVDSIGDGVDVRGPSGAGTGDVVGPSSATDGNLAAFDMTTGKLVKDSGKSVSDFATAAQGELADTAVQPGDLGTAALADTTDFATSTQGGKADTAVQPGALATVATSGDYGDLVGAPSLGDAAAKNTGTTAGTVAAGDDSRITGAAQKSSNLSDLADAAAARTNLGLATVAATGAYSDLSGAPSTVSQAEAEAGTATTVRMWTAQRVAQAIAALAGGGGGGYTLRGTQSTTSGSSKAFSGLDLSGVTRLLLVLDGVSTSAAAAIRINGTDITTSLTAAANNSGFAEVVVPSGWGYSVVGPGTTNNVGSTGFNSNVSPSTTTVTVAVSTGNFDAGSISLYTI